MVNLEALGTIARGKKTYADIRQPTPDKETRISVL